MAAQLLVVVWNDQAPLTVEQPEPPPDHALSDTEPPPPCKCCEVPPTATVVLRIAGQDTPAAKPCSPVDTVTDFLGWLYPGTWAAVQSKPSAP
jgi:hypothetical protein